MNKERNWLGNRLAWRSVQLSGGGVGRAAIISCRPERIPWLADLHTCVVSIDHQTLDINFFATGHISAGLAEIKPFWTIPRNCLGINELSELVHWPGAEGVYSEFIGLDLPQAIALGSINDLLLAKCLKARVPGWWTINREGSGVSMIGEALDQHGIRRALEIQNQYVYIYRAGLGDCSALAERDQLVGYLISDLTLQKLEQLLQHDQAVQLCSVVRMYRHALFQCVIENDLPF